MTSSALSPLALLRVVGWKLLQTVRHGTDRRLGGHARRVALTAAWAREWRASLDTREPPLAAWRSRPEAGRLWLPDDPLRWASETCSDDDLEAANAALRGEFNLLGSGVVSLGHSPAWRRDLYTGREWPRVPLDYSAVARGDGSDIRTVWELSRCRHFLALARAHAKTRDAGYRDAFVRHVTSFIADNPMGLGPHWLSPMDAGIRAANWVLAAEIFAADSAIPAAFWESMLANLHATGLFVERYREWHPVYRGNHYVANGVALVYLGAFFGGTPAGRRWLRRGGAILGSEIRYQVGDDGVSFEGSLAYHRFVTECFGWGAELLRRNGVATFDDECDTRLRKMFGFIDAYLPSSDLAPMLGDADDGRLHAVSAAGETQPRRHRLGLPDRWWPATPPGPGAFRDGGFFVLRHGGDHLVVRCGRVGLRGAGSHDHNDQLSFELCVSGRRIVADSGTFTYTRDLAARYAFRSTAAHSVVQLGDEEQNPIAVERPWRILGDRASARCVAFEAGAQRQMFEGVHRGFAHRPSEAVCRRRIELDVGRRVWTITDAVEGRGTDHVAWRLHLAATAVEAKRTSDSDWAVTLPGNPAVTIRIHLPPSLHLVVLRTDASDRYGVRYERPSLLATGECALPMIVRATFSASES